MDKETTTSVTIDRKTFARLDRLAKSNNVSKRKSGKGNAETYQTL
mgnify:CR=1 FL=1